MNKDADVLKGLTIYDEPKSWLGDFADTLKKWYHDFGCNLTDVDAIIEIERQFGDEVVNRLCKPHNMSEGACWLISLDVAKGS